MAINQTTRRASLVAIAATALLLALLLTWQLSGTDFNARWVLTALLALPAAVVLASLLRHRPRARAWTILGAIPYVTLGLTELIANPQQRVWAAACAVLAFIQFVVLAWLLRMQRDAQR
jgi:uncharacterized membrane protein